MASGVDFRQNTKIRNPTTTTKTTTEILKKKNTNLGYVFGVYAAVVAIVVVVVATFLTRSISHCMLPQLKWKHIT